MGDVRELFGPALMRSGPFYLTWDGDGEIGVLVAGDCYGGGRFDFGWGRRDIDVVVGRRCCTAAGPHEE